MIPPIIAAAYQILTAQIKLPERPGKMFQKMSLSWQLFSTCKVDNCGKSKNFYDGVVKSSSCSLLQFLYHYDVPYVRRNNIKIARLQYEAFNLTIQNFNFHEFIF